MTTQQLPRTLDELRESVGGLAPDPDADPGRPNHYHAAAFFRHDADSGSLANAHGQTLFRLGASELDAFCSGIEVTTLYRAGELAGLADLAAAVPRLTAEFGVPLDKVNLTRVLQTWWWPMRAQGWGECRFDFSGRDRGLIVVRLGDPLGEPVLHLLAGLFASVFGYFAGRQLVCLPFATEGGPATFLISTRKLVRLATELLDQGTQPGELLDRLLSRETDR